MEKTCEDSRRSRVWSGDLCRSNLWCAFSTVIVVQLAMGCNRPIPPRPPPPPPEEQAETFQQIVEHHDRAAVDGWDEEECRDVSARFLALSESAQGLPAALYNAAMVLRECDSMEEATTLLRRADAVVRERRGGEDSGYAPALLVLGIDAARQGERSRAAALFVKARRVDPRSAEVYTNIASIQRASGQMPEALKNLRRALAYDSGQMAAYAQMALFYLDLSEDNPDMLDLTTLVCQQALSRARETKASPVQAAPIHNAWGLALVKSGDVVGAVGQFDKARTLDPELYEAHLNFGSINLSFRGYEEAERAFRRAVDLRPDSYEARLSLGVALRGLKRFGDARSAYLEARGIDGERPGAHYNLGVLAQDYLFGETPEQASQVELLREARRSFQQFLEACERDSVECVRQPPGDPPEDLRDVARRRIRDCDSVIAALTASEA